MASAASEQFRHDILNEVSSHLDSLISFCQNGDEDLGALCAKFQMEHAAAQAEYSIEMTKMRSVSESRAQEYGERHLVEAMKRMIDFAAESARVVLVRCANRRALGASVKPLTCVSPNSDSSGKDSLSEGSGPKEDTELCSNRSQRSCSVEDVTEGGDHWIATGANVMHASVSILSLILLGHASVRPLLQTYMAGPRRILDYIVDALSVDRETELQFFAEGYRTSHLSLLSNLTHDASSVCKEAGGNSRLMQLVVNSTRLDEENPGMGEWAEFSIRNLCHHSAEAREFIKNLRLGERTRSVSPLEH